MEEVGCLLCGNRQHQVRYRGRDYLCGVPGEFTIVECVSCGFHYLTPRPDQTEIGRFYPDDYDAYTSWDKEESAALRAARADDIARRAGVIERYASPGDLLDVGCASGDFLAAMRDRGDWRVRGLEPSATAVARARASYGLTVDEGSLESACYEPGSFDVITMWEVLEHVPQPRETLRRVYELLRPGGTLVMSMPCRDALDARIFGTYWIGLDVPRHFSIFSHHDIRRALLDAGFTRPDIFTTRGRLGGAHTEFLCVMLSLSFWLQGGENARPLRRAGSSALQRLVGHQAGVIPLFLLTLPYSRLTRALNRATAMTVVARRA
ncbi:MAG TPA: class I SAM-dependent methyltransferase [Thermomicrobiaceae bacterium]|nr:class I SAM-dependent methyltransferase [Thermomicrobiaceae bacterium]